jgi:hypothetical protein
MGIPSVVDPSCAYWEPYGTITCFLIIIKSIISNVSYLMIVTIIKIRNNYIYAYVFAQHIYIYIYIHNSLRFRTIIELILTISCVSNLLLQGPLLFL